MLLSSEPTARRKAVIWAVTGICLAWFLAVNAHNVLNAIGPYREMQQFSRDEASTAYGVWLMWSTPTIDFGEPMRSGLFHSIALALGALAAPFHVPSMEHFVVASRVAALLLGCATLVAATWVVGTVSAWSWATVLMPLYLAMSAQFNFMATEIRVEMAMFLFEVLAIWAMSRFVVDPGRRWFKWTMVLITLSFSGKPSVILMYPLFIGVNLFQVWRDKQPFWPEFRWRFPRGILYFFVTLLLATPNSFFSFGLFMGSLKNEIDASSKNRVVTPFWRWLEYLLRPSYIGPTVLALVAVLLAGFFYLAWRDRNSGKGGSRDPLAAFVWLGFLWTFAFWLFVLVKSRSYILRYLDPGWITFAVLGVALVAYLMRENKRIGWFAMAAAVLATLPTVPANRDAHTKHLAHMATYEARVAAKRQLQADLEATIPAGTPIMATPDILFDSDRHPNSSRYFRYNPKYLRLEPKFIVASRYRENRHNEFLDRKVTWDNEYDVERKATAVFYKALQDNNLWGTVEVVRTWDGPGITVYRFKVPVTIAYTRQLTERIYAEVGVTPPKL